MKDVRTIALAGAAILFVGVFMPILSIPIAGPVNYFQNGKGDGVIVLAIAVIAALLALTGKTRHALWAGIASLLILAFTFLNFEQKMSDMREKMSADLEGNPFRGFAEAAMGTIQIQWGWAVLVIGALTLIYAGWMARKQAT